MTGESREMTLDEWVDRLPPHHGARRERDRLRQAEAEIERLRAERDDLEKRAVALGKDAVKLDDLRLSALRQAEAERDRARELAVWVASKVDCDVLPSNNGRKTVRLESFALGVRVIPTDGTDAGILAALEKARGMGSDD